MFVIQHFGSKTFLHVNYGIDQHDHLNLRNEFVNLGGATVFSNISAAVNAAADYGQRHECRHPGRDTPSLVLVRIAQAGRRIVETL